MFYSLQNTGLFTFLVKLIPRYFILFDVILNGIVFLLSLFDSLILVYGKVILFKCINFVFLQLY